MTRPTTCRGRCSRSGRRTTRWTSPPRSWWRRASPPRRSGSMPDNDVTYLDAVSQALMAEMEADESVFLIGEDVGQFGGAFKVTKGFLEKFGERRVVDTPLAESGFTGLAAGAALNGLRPVAELQFAYSIS